jgi:hypothetical protein
VGSAVFEVSEAELRWARAGGSGPPPAPGRAASYAPVFYPGTADPSAAATIQVASGEERSGIDMALRIVAMSRIAGRLLDVGGQPVSPATVSLFPRHTGRPAAVDVLVSSGALVLPRAVVSSSGFAFTGVAPGEYTLVARSGSGGRATTAAPSGPAALWSVTDLTVDGSDQTGVVLTLLPGVVVSGTLAFERTLLVPPTDPSAVEVTLTASPALPGISAAPRATVSPAGTFRFASVPPGRYLLHAEIPVSSGARWTLKSAMLDNRDLADRPLEAVPGGADVQDLAVTFTDRAAEVSGRLIDASGQAVTAYSIVVLTTDQTLWLPNARRIRAVRPATDGAFTVAGLPAGDYVIAAAEDVEPADLADPAFLEQLLASAIPLRLREGEKARQDLLLQVRRTPQEFLHGQKLLLSPFRNFAVLPVVGLCMKQIDGLLVSLDRPIDERAIEGRAFEADQIARRVALTSLHEGFRGIRLQGDRQSDVPARRQFQQFVVHDEIVHDQPAAERLDVRVRGLL